MLRRFAAKYKTHYDALEVSPCDSLGKIRENFLALTKRYHPDVYRGSEADRYKRIVEAYETLKSPRKRKIYDQSIGLVGGEASTPTGEVEAKQPSTRSRSNETAPAATIYHGVTLEEEVQKLKSRKLKTDFQSIRYLEDQRVRQLSDYEKQREDFRVGFNDPQPSIHHMGLDYQDVLQGSIEDRNTETRQREAKGRSWRDKVPYYTTLRLFLALVCTSVFLYFVKETISKRAVYRRMREEYELKEAQEAMEAYGVSVNNRFRF